ncbi:MAG TPA: alpha/beta hydrolase family protein [Planctomycetota bacterium]|nr:alpha/beta hydrolase family protein [Planctomycetota bacterium]
MATVNPARLTPAQFKKYQDQRRKLLWQLLGDLPKPRRPKSKLLKAEKIDGATIEHLELDLNGVELVPARLLVPDKRERKAPGMLYIHAHGGSYTVGKEEMFMGRDVLPAYAPEFVKRGIVALTIDSWCFSGRKHLEDGNRGEMDTFKHMLWKGQTLWGMMMFDEYQAFSYLLSRKEVDPKRVGAMGLSMGSTKSWWLAALDPRVKVCMELCCLTDYQELIRINHLRGHGIYYYIPALLKHFTAAQVNELIVPRAHLSLNGREDLLTPPEGVEKIAKYLAPLYKKFGKPEDCRVELFNCGHREIPEMRAIMLEWLDRYFVNG